LDELKASSNAVQKMTPQGAVEQDLATGEATSISARAAPDGSDVGASVVIGRVSAQAKVNARKKAVRKANEKIRAQFRDEPLSKSGERLSFEKAKPSGKLKEIAARPGREALLAAKSKAWRDADGNFGMDAAGATEDAAGEAAGKVGGTVTAAVRKQAQKKAIKRGYAKALRAGGTPSMKDTAATAKKATAKAKEASQRTAAFVKTHWKGIGIALVIVGLVALLFAAFSSCGAMLQGGFQSVIATSYTSEDSDIEQTERDYTSKERALSNRIDNIEGAYPGYDEYRYGLDQIGHDPFELASYLTAVYQTYTPDMVAAELSRLFNQQYTLTLTPVTETRYRTETRTGYRTEERTGYRDEERTGYRDEQRTGYRYERDPATGRYARVEYTYTVQVPYTYTVSVPYTYTVQVPYTYTVEVSYSYHILNVKLQNRSLGSVAAGSMTAGQTEMYAVYMETKGNKPELFAENPYVNRGEYTGYDIPPEALTDTRFAAMMREAEKYLGYPYVWGGASPETSFDCSGYVSWVVNHSGWSMGRLTAQGLMDRCAVIAPLEARPGDLIFFQGTYDTQGASHVGIYVGGGMMIHCGNPISYASTETSYWQQHFYAYGRLP
jgi:cell wall-associated NlpC family hydrolase